ncbi:alginate export family protein [Holophaga foetida]|uniref:alginate export family protein n=1 Tax=Holophaga foetida TaxID=35839 RepID=UPI0002473EB9|nr:alginate export family protein [Holophaga foetida]
MKLNHRTALLCATLTCGLIPGSGLAAQDAAAKSFTPTIDLGFEERVRTERWNNADFNSAAADARVQYRFRSRLWAVADLTPDLEIAAGICHEARKITRPDNAAYNGREVFFDTLYVDYKFTPQLSARVGRQNIVRGEGFILMDGTGGDGSRTTYFNAVDVAYAWSKSKLEFIGITNHSDDRLPVLNEDDTPINRLSERNEQAIGLYYTGKEWSGNTLDAYYILKSETHDYRAATAASFQPERQFSTLGARAAQEFGHGWSATGEFAYQWGRQDANAAQSIEAKDISAWGGYARVKKSFDAAWKPSVSAGYIALSGQDDSNKVTAWNPVFSRFPKWSEYYVYAIAPEKGVAYWQNLGMWELEFKCSPCKAVDLRATYYRMAALEPSTGTDKDRGDLYELRADMRFTQDLKGHVVYERMIPGNFKASNDPGYFLRAEVSYTFKHRFGL